MRYYIIEVIINIVLISRTRIYHIKNPSITNDVCNRRRDRLWSREKYLAKLSLTKVFEYRIYKKFKK